jgi:putative serine protease PepD
MKRHLLPLASLAAAGLIGGIGGGALVAATGEDTATTTVTADAPAVPTSSSTASAAAVYKRAIDGVVTVSASSNLGAGTGSGFVYDADGHVVTNEHVVDGATSVSVTFQDGTEATARVVGTDKSTDVAVLEVEGEHDLAPLPLGSSGTLQIGMPVIAIGSPFGLDGTLTTGVVSGLDREIRAPDGFGISGVIQTDAALNHGNSGGPLLDSAGRVIGINSQIQSESGGNVGVGYAVPIDTVKTIVGQLLENGSVEHAYLGVSLGDADGGGAVVDVVAGAPADRGGLEDGDVVVEVDGEAVDDGAALRDAVAAHQPGDELELKVERGGDTETVTVTLGSRPDSVQ